MRVALRQVTWNSSPTYRRIRSLRELENQGTGLWGWIVKKGELQFGGGCVLIIRVVECLSGELFQAPTVSGQRDTDLIEASVSRINSRPFHHVPFITSLSSKSGLLIVMKLISLNPHAHGPRHQRETSSARRPKSHASCGVHISPWTYTNYLSLKVRKERKSHVLLASSSLKGRVSIVIKNRFVSSSIPCTIYRAGLSKFLLGDDGWIPSIKAQRIGLTMPIHDDVNASAIS